MSQYGGSKPGYGKGALYALTPQPILSLSTPASGIYFYISGTNLPVYVFAQNPSSVDDYKTQSFGTLPTLETDDIQQYSIYDSEIITYTWDRVKQSTYTALKPYAARDANGNIPTSYMWDQVLGEMQGAPVKVIDVYAEPIKAEFTVYEWRMTMTFKPDGAFPINNAKFYQTNLSFTTGIGYQLAVDITKGNFNNIFSIQLFDGGWNPLITGVGWQVFNGATNQIFVTGLSQTALNNASYLFSIQNGWVSSNYLISGIISGTLFTLV